MSGQRRALVFACQGNWLVGILHSPAQPCKRGVLIVTGGPQYRIGSHRQFVLLADQLTAAGIAVMRFDYRGMGDSEGTPRHFEQIGDDLGAAIAEFFSAQPAMKELVLWGLCDGATAAARYAIHDPRIIGLVMLNPWVRTEQSYAKTTLRHYYLQRLGSKDFWRKLAHGAVRWSDTLRSVVALLTAARSHADGASGLPQRLYHALSQFQGHLLIVLSGADLGAREFLALAAHQRHWRKLLDRPRVQVIEIARANHTFSSLSWRTEVANVCQRWIASW